MGSNRQSDRLSAVTGKITVEEGVLFPDDSNGLFTSFYASSIDFKNNVSNVKDMSYMYMFVSLSIKLLDLSNWNTSNVTDVSYMFFLSSIG